VRLEVLEHTDGCVIASWDRILLVRWRDNVTVHGIRRIRAQVAALHAAHPEVMLFSLVPPRSSGPPDAEAQRAIRNLTQGPSQGLAGVAIVFEGSGFIAATVMALTLKLGGGGTAGTPTRVFRTLEEAVRWAEERLGPPGLAADGLKAALALAVA
jgi:hypothetical protein